MTLPKIHPVKKDRLFYNQFEYCISFYLDEVNCLRELDHTSIDSMIERRQQWREIAQQRWINAGRSHSTIIGRRWRPITPDTVKNLHELATVLLSTVSKYKLVVSMDQGYVYSNDMTLLQTLNQMTVLGYKSVSQAVVVRPKDTIQLKKSNHKFRTYFGMQKLSTDQKQVLEDFLLTQQQFVRLSPALQRWIDQPFNRTQDYFFVDHDSETWLTMLNLVQPGIIRKTMHIITTK